MKNYIILLSLFLTSLAAHAQHPQVNSKIDSCDALTEALMGEPNEPTMGYQSITLYVGDSDANLYIDQDGILGGESEEGLMCFVYPAMVVWEDNTITGNQHINQPDACNAYSNQIQDFASLAEPGLAVSFINENAYGAQLACLCVLTVEEAWSIEPEMRVLPFPHPWVDIKESKLVNAECYEATETE